jgi:hypothetical protein
MNSSTACRSSFSSVTVHWWIHSPGLSIICWGVQTVEPVISRGKCSKGFSWLSIGGCWPLVRSPSKNSLRSTGTRRGRPAGIPRTPGATSKSTDMISNYSVEWRNYAWDLERSVNDILDLVNTSVTGSGRHIKIICYPVSFSMRLGERNSIQPARLLTYQGRNCVK